jgi:serine/threonine protein kinase
MSKKIGKYILEEKLSRGTFGICCKAKDDKNKEYAIKKIEIVNQKEIEGILNEINILKIMKSKHSVEFIESIKNEYVITIQSFIRRFIIYKKIKLLKNKIIIIQKNSRLFLIKKKYFKELSKIKENIEFNKRKKNFNQNMKLMKIKKEAISVIEKYWSKVLLKRENNFINNKNNDNDDINNCKDLYQKFIILRKQTNNLKRDLIDFTKKEKEKDKQREIEIEKEREKFKLNYKIKLN